MRMVPGGRVELPTRAFAGPRSTGELPRHRKNPKIVAARSCDVETESTRLAIRRGNVLGCEGLLHRLVELPHPVFLLQHFARLGAIGGTDDAVFLHDVDQPCRPAITDAQPPLQSRSRSAPHFANHAHGLLVKFVVDLFLASLTASLSARFFLRRLDRKS